MIVVCSGKQKSTEEVTQLDLFEKNAPEVHNLAIYAAEFNPNAVFCIAVPPINSLVPMVSEVCFSLIFFDHLLLIICFVGIQKSKSL